MALDIAGEASTIAGGAISSTLGQVIGLALQPAKDAEQLKQNNALEQEQVANQETATAYNEQEQEKLWQDTSYPAQMAEMQKAGLNPALMYGQGGGGGVTANLSASSAPSSSQAPNSAEQTNAGVNIANSIGAIGMQLAQAQNAEAQANLAKTQETKIAGPDTQNENADTNMKNFQNAVNNAVGITSTAGNIINQQSITEANAKITQLGEEKTLADYNAWQNANFDGKPSDDPTSPLAKAYAAGLQQTLTNLQQAQTTLDTSKATQTIEEFKANLTKQGIDPSSPWYVKIIGDILNKANINPAKITGDVISQ